MTIWHGATTCDFCHNEIGAVLYDARTDSGPWATMCWECNRIHGAGILGLGQGQRYLQNIKGVYEKVEG